MIKDDNYDEIKESVIETLGWPASGLCLAVIRTLREIDVWVVRWTNSADPREVLTHVDMGLARHPNDVYAAMKRVLKEYNLEFLDWEWYSLPEHEPPFKPQMKWAATLSFRSQHTNWTENDPPPGGYRIRNGWCYEPDDEISGWPAWNIKRNEAPGN